MQTQALYNLSVNSVGKAARVPRVGLLHGRTGIPVFLLFLETARSVRKVELHSADQLTSETLKAASPADKRAWELLSPFFEAQGAYALALISPIGKSPKSRLAAMLGTDRGIGKRSGIHLVKEMTEFADLLCVPQASEWLEEEEHRRFYQGVFDLVEGMETMFALVDFPKNAALSETEPWLRTAMCPAAAAYYPWVLVNETAYPPGPVVAALIQQTDATLGIQELPANRKLSAGIKPLLNQSPAQVRDALSRRLNTLVTFSENDVRIWGGATLADSLDFNSRLISLQRTTTALKEAIHKICEPYVLDSALDDLSVFIDTALQNFLRSVKGIFDADTSQPFTTAVALVPGKGEDVIQVQVKYVLPHALNQLSLTLGLGT